MVALAILFGASVPRCLGASAVQCPEGTPPPCRGRAAAPARPAVDPQRIAILPFRVTTADTMLGEGVAELLSAEFTGESGPRAVHMGTVLRAWRGAGGRAGAPLPPEDAVRAARAMGAGIVVDGSVVGIGQRLTVSASVVTVSDGRSRRATPVSGSADSLDVLLRRFTINLMAAAGGEARATERGALTESPAAMRGYLEGLASWRRYDLANAAAAFERAFAEDSTFARAAFMRYVTTLWGRPSQQRRWDRAVWGLRERLSGSDRVLLVAYLGENFPAPRTPEQILADRERAAEQLPESPEAQYILGDWLLHYGSAANVTDRLARAIALFKRSVALDTQETVLSHLALAAAMAGDTTLLRNLQPAMERGEALWGLNWMSASLLGDQAWLARMRRRPGRLPVFPFVMLPMLGLPDSVTEEAYELLGRDSASREVANSLRYLAAIYQGRPARAERLAGWLPASSGSDAIRLINAVVADGDTAIARERAESDVVRTSRRGDVSCAYALWLVTRGQDVPWLDSLRNRGASPMCAAVLAMERARLTGAPDFAQRLASADSAVRNGLSNLPFSGFENVLLARGWESLGEHRRALLAIRLQPFLNGVVWAEATGAREEGRLALMVGDTASAIAAWRQYLGMRRDPEPVLIPQRDSVRAALARLERR